MYLILIEFLKNGKVVRQQIIDKNMKKVVLSSKKSFVLIK